MKPKYGLSTGYLLKIALLLGIYGFFAGECQAQLGGPPRIAVQPLGVAVQNGGTAILTSTAVSLTSMDINWYCNGQKIPSSYYLNVAVPLVGTVSTLTIPNVSTTNGGTYYMKVENGVGEVTSSNATLVVAAQTVSSVLGILSSGTGMKTNGFQVHMAGPSGNYVLEATTNFKTWVPIVTNAAPSGDITYIDTQATNYPSRYYRIRLQ